MKITGAEFIKQFESVVPLDLAEDSDPVGLHIGTLNKPINRVMMTLDVRPDVVQEAIDKKIDLIVAKHPPIFRPVKHLLVDDFQTKMYADLLKHDIAVYAAHTNMDIVDNGLNDLFCEMLDIDATDYLRQTHEYFYRKLVVYVPTTHAESLREAFGGAGIGAYHDYDYTSFSSHGTGRFRPLEKAQPAIGENNELTSVEEEKIEVMFLPQEYPTVLSIINEYHPYEEPMFDIFPLENISKTYGIGRIGTLPQPMPLLDFVEKVKQTFGLNAIRLTTDTKDKQVKTVAICGGSGEKFYKDALKKGADVYITGDVYYHTAHDMMEEGLSVIDPGHYIESVCKKYYVDLFNQWKQQNDWDVTFIESDVNTNPFEII